jgi:uncharacterized membrane protein YjfL (UPF0719 family)
MMRSLFFLGLYIAVTWAIFLTIRACKTDYDLCGRMTPGNCAATVALLASAVGVVSVIMRAMQIGG